jgi:hypothetical protein
MYQRITELYKTLFSYEVTLLLSHVSCYFVLFSKLYFLQPHCLLVHTNTVAIFMNKMIF